MSVDNLAARNEAARLFEDYTRKFDADDPATEAAWDAYEAMIDKAGIALLTTEDEGEVIRCAISGAPIVESDETVIVLKSALEKTEA